MKVKACHPRELAIDLLDRSDCAVQVAAVLADNFGTYSWGWNGQGPTGYGIHAEAHCLSRANTKRAKRLLTGNTLYVAARRKKSGNTLTARPCEACQVIIKNVRHVFYRDGSGDWIKMR